MRYLALLRGINVGGGNIIRMGDLKLCFEAAGFGNVATYIQSGNVLFEAAKAGRGEIVGAVERALSERFRPYRGRIVLRSHAELGKVVRDAPKGFGGRPLAYRYDVVYLKDPLTAREALKSVTVKPGVDEVFAGRGVLYFSRLIAKAAQSRLSRLVSMPVYQQMTIRNWNTTVKLLELMDARGKR